jgi:P2 family phage contractile tail tube protein
MLPHKLKAFVLYVDGIGYAGQCEEVTTPKLARKMEEFRSGGMDAPVKIDLGGEAYEMELTLGEAVPALLAQYGNSTVDGVKIRLMGSTEADDNHAIVPIEIVAHGRFSEIDMGSFKPGDSSTTKYSCALSYYKYIANKVELLEFDVPKNIQIVNGVDKYTERRSALGLSY